MPEQVDYRNDGGIVTLSLNRPEKLNAFNDAMVVALGEALRRFDGDKEALVAVIHGNGRAFSTGADVQQRQLRSREEFERLGGPQAHGAVAHELLSHAVHWKPVISAVHGYVMGLAVGIALDCDLVVAEAGAKFQITETSRGIGAARYWGLMHFCGAGAFGNEVALTGRFFTAEEAHAHNLINRLAPAGKALEVALELARAVAENPPLSVRATVRSRRWYMDQIARETSMHQAPMRLYLTEDFQEAARAMSEKRKPAKFKGR